MIVPFRKDESFLADVRNARQDPDTVHIWWLGQSGFLVHRNQRFLLLDPYLSDSLTKKYASTDKPHVRMTERVIAPEALNFIDIVTSSHNHTAEAGAQMRGDFIANGIERVGHPVEGVGLLRIV